uniref:Uncharacterized protein n=1 Tax=Streptococcus intermedius TaxID=1338 RepID=A0A1S6JMB7_STRIT|nr:hypothetical protein [Streptococcus intermedius]
MLYSLGIIRRFIDYQTATYVIHKYHLIDVRFHTIESRHFHE